MKILIVRPVLSQIKAIQTTGSSVSVLFMWDKYQDPYLTNKSIEDFNGVLIHEWKTKSVEKFNINKFIFIINLLNNYKYDVVHLNGLRDVIIFYLCRIISINKPKVITTSRNSYLWTNSIKNRVICIIVNLFTDGYVALSTINKNLLIRYGFPVNKICFIPNAFNSLEAYCEFDKAKFNKKKQLIYVASVIRNKSQITLIEVIHQINNPNVELLLIGSIHNDPDYFFELQKKIKKLKLENHVRFLGKLSHKEVMHYYSSSDIVVFPTMSEMMPRAVIEAMWLGKPVVASRVDGILDLITDEKTGLLCKPGDVKGFSDALQFLLENPDEAERMGMAGKEFVQKHCSLESVGKAYIKFYKQILQTL